MRAEFDKELSLILDSKTRWNSLLAMLERVAKLRKALRKVFIHIGQTHIIAYSLTEEVVSALQPIKVGVEMIFREEANLLTADETIKAILQELETKKNDISIKLKAAVLRRFEER